MTLFASLNGTPVTRARIVTPYQGIWHADVWMDRVTDTSGSQALEVNGQVWTCTATRAVDFAGERSLRVVGGAGGWGTTIPPMFYAGAKLSTILNDTAALVGEQVIVSADSVISPFYVIAGDSLNGGECLASLVLQQLCGDAWWMDPSGVVHTGNRPAATIASPFTLQTIEGPPGYYEVDTDTISDWVPGASFSGPTGSGTISRVEHILDAGKLHTRVMVPASSTAITDRLRAAFKQLLVQYLPNLLYYVEWPYTVLSVSGGPAVLISAKPVDPRLPPVTNLKLRPGSDGGTSLPIVGATILVGFAAGDPTQPEVRSLDPATSPSKVYLGAGSLDVIIADGTAGAARVGDAVSVTISVADAALFVAPSGGGPCVLSGPLQVPGTITGGSAKVAIG